MTFDDEVKAEVAKMAREGDPWARIIRAWQRGTGLRLTADDVDTLGRDGAIWDCAAEEANRRLDAADE